LQAEVVPAKKEIDVELPCKGADAVELPEKFSIGGNVNGLGVDVRWTNPPRTK
jgi:hypothetical protein